MTRIGAALRPRFPWAVALTVVIAGGLASRSGSPLVPPWLARHAGDALWTAAVYLALGLLRPRTPASRLLVLALSVSLAVELSQLWRADWLEEWRRTWPGKLLLGRGWQWADLPRYAVGGVLAWTLDRLLLRRAPSGGL